MSRLCSIYRCSKKEGMYLYVDKTEGLTRVPDLLFRQIGKTELAMTLLLKPEKKLARVSASEVLAAIEEQGFYLQMPPSLKEILDDKDMQAISDKNTKM